MTGDKKGSGHSTPDPRDASPLVVGIVGRPHGLAGELSVEVTTSFPQRFVEGLSLLWTRGVAQREVTVATARPHGKRMLLSFVGVPDRETARALVGGELSVGEKESFPAPEGFYYSHELAGLPCDDRQGRLLGHAVRLDQTPAGPLLEIDTPRRKGVLVPFVAGIVVSVDREAGRIVLDLPEGLLDL